jgi:hypothetical protein
MSKINDLLEIEGYKHDGTGVEGFIQDYMFDSIVPAICMNPGCDYTTHLEPDSRHGHCENCGTKTMESGLSLLGLI